MATTRSVQDVFLDGLRNAHERRMAAAIAEGLDAVTRRYVQLDASDERADI
ncbi:hypothetical protein [Paracoccus sp. (in: a-proteobacteria)]|uniref:hypothetical protein n=1 Tax=Paracoccus sp. TaxID=267 RepID=UPI00396CB94F